jgi:hypothetical protein
MKHLDASTLGIGDTELDERIEGSAQPAWVARPQTEQQFTRNAGWGKRNDEKRGAQYRVRLGSQNDGW